MTKRIEITIGQELDSFLGNDPDAIATINIEASKESYEQAISKLAERELNVEIAIAWDGNNDTSEYEGDKDELQSDIEDLVDRVYNSQDFWVNK
jgi:FMN phosphatase YigB (HAD superfamily)